MTEAAVDSRRRAIVRDVGRLSAKLLTVGAFAAIVHVVYQQRIAPVYSYAGLTYREPDPYGYVVALLACATIAAALPSRITMVSHLVQWIIFVAAGMPSILIAQYSATLSPDDATTAGLAVAMTMILVRVLTLRGPTGFIPTLRIAPSLYWGGIVLGSALIYLYLVATTGINLQYLSFSDVYAVRAEFKESLASAPGLGYILPIQYSATNPLLMAYGLHARRRGLLVAGVVGQIVIYLATGYKIVLLSVLAVMGLALLLRKHEQALSAVRLVLSIAAAAIAAVAADMWSGSRTLTSVFVTRFLVIPGALTGAYVAIFADRPKLGFANVLPFVESPYSESPFLIVGAEFFRSPGNNANVNLFGDGYLNFGYLGMFIEGLVLVVLLWSADDVTSNVPLPLGAAIFVMPSVSLTNGSVFTAVLTYGFGAALAACAALPDDVRSNLRI